MNENHDPNAPAVDVNGMLHSLHTVEENGDLKSIRFEQQRTSEGRAMNLVVVELCRNGEVYQVMRLPVFAALKFHDQCKITRGLRKSMFMAMVMDDGAEVSVFDRPDAV